jgi:hypothetical protein
MRRRPCPRLWACCCVRQRVLRGDHRHERAVERRGAAWQAAVHRLESGRGWLAAGRYWPAGRRPLDTVRGHAAADWALLCRQIQFVTVPGDWLVQAAA